MNSYGELRNNSRLEAPGSYMERLHDALQKKLVSYRLQLIEALEKDMPYRSVQLSTSEQYIKFEKMDGNSWAQLVMRLYERYRGLPDATNRVNNDLMRYIRQMMTYGETIPSAIDPNYQAMFDPRLRGGSLDAP